MLTRRSSRAAVGETVNTSGERGKLEHGLLTQSECRQESVRVVATGKETWSTSRNTGRESRGERATIRDIRERRRVEPGLLTKI